MGNVSVHDTGFDIGDETHIGSYEPPAAALKRLLVSAEGERTRVKPDNRGRFGRPIPTYQQMERGLCTHFKLQEVRPEADLVGRRNDAAAQFAAQSWRLNRSMITPAPT